MDKTQAAIELFDKRANEYQAKYMDVSLYSHSLDLFCDVIAKQQADVLELACGPGNITRYVLDKRPDLKILGTDLSPNMIALAQSNNPEAQFGIMDSRDVGAIGKQYDALICGFCLPYLSREEAVSLIADAAGVLKPGGVFYLSTMEDDYTKSSLQSGSAGEQLFIYYHQADYLTDAFQQNGFKIIELERLKYQPGPDHAEVTDLVIIAEKD